MLERWMGFTLLRIVAKPFRVRKRPSWNVNNGALVCGEILMKSRSALTGQRRERFLMSLMVNPCRKGSVFEAFMYMSMVVLEMIVRSVRHSVVAGSYDLTCEEVYSETRKKPKKAVIIAAQIISLSSL